MADNGGGRRGKSEGVNLGLKLSHLWPPRCCCNSLLCGFKQPPSLDDLIMATLVRQLDQLVHHYKADPESVYNTWYAGSDARMKAFRAIRLGVKDVVSAIAGGTFGNDFKGSPLEVVLTAITEQKQVFEGAAHPFDWKRKAAHPEHLRERSQQEGLRSVLERMSERN